MTSEALREGGGELRKNICSIDRVKDGHIYGMFPEFIGFIVAEHRERFLQRLASFEKAQARRLVDAIPAAWQVSQELRDAIATFLYDRAQFLVTFAPKAICGPLKQLELFEEGKHHG